MKTPAEIEAQRQMDEEILRYVREMQAQAPVTRGAVHSYLTRVRRRRVTEAAVEDRLEYLQGRLLLRSDREWAEGEGYVTFFEVTAKGRDVLDGVIPPEG